MVNLPEFYIIPEDVFRLGNVTSPRLSHVRPSDAQTTTVNGVTVVIADGRHGVSVFDRAAIARVALSGWVWRIAGRTPLPAGLKLVHLPLPDTPGHYVIAPMQNMPLSKYRGLLEELALHATRVGKDEVKRA